MNRSFTGSAMYEAELISERIRKDLSDDESHELCSAALNYRAVLLKIEAARIEGLSSKDAA